MDHIAHVEGLDGRAFHLTDPNPKTAGEVIDIFARAAHAPQSSVRLPAAVVDLAAPFVKAVASLPPGDIVTDRVLSDFGIPRSVLTYINYPTHFDSRQAQAALAGTDIRVPPLEAYADKLWDYWERHLDPDLYEDRTLVGAVRGRRGLVSGTAQIAEQQVPDELLRLVRSVRGRASLEAAVRGRVVMVTGASSGIGKAAALQIADAGGIVLLVARTAEKLEEIEGDDRGWRRHGLRARGGPLRHGRHRPHGRRGPGPARPRRRPRQQRRALDPPLDRPLLRPLPRLRADDAAQLLRRGEADPEAAAGDARARAPATSSTSARSACRRTRRASPPTSRRRRRSTRSRAASRRRSSTTACTSRRSTCRWCGRR